MKYITSSEQKRMEKYRQTHPFILACFFSIFCCLFLFSTAFAAVLPPNKLRLSYAMGYTVGKALKEHDVKLNALYFTKGFEEATDGMKYTYMNEHEIKETLKQYRDASIQEKQDTLKALADKNKQAGKAYLETFATKKGVFITSSGIAYRILQPGRGVKPSSTSTITVDYTASHINGKVFDQNQSAVFKMPNVISGWQKILPLMETGATWEVVVPANLAYGSEGAPGILGPDETIVYKIHLLKINSQ